MRRWSKLSQPSSARRPASVIRRRAILILRAPIRMISQRAVASPSWTKIVDQVGYHGDSKPMGEQRRPGAAAQPHSSEYLERPALFRAEVGFSRRDGDDVRRGWHRGKSSGGKVRGNGCPVKDIPRVPPPPV